MAHGVGVTKCVTSRRSLGRDMTWWGMSRPFVNSQRPQRLMPILREPRNLDWMSLSLEEKRKFSPKIKKKVVATKFSDSDDKSIAQRTQCWTFEILDRKNCLSLSGRVVRNWRLSVVNWQCLCDISLKTMLSLWISLFLCASTGLRPSSLPYMNTIFELHQLSIVLVKR